MKTAKLIGRSIMRSFACTAIFSLCVFMFQKLDTPELTPSMFFNDFFVLLILGIVCGFAQELFKLRILPFFIRVAIHYSALLLSFVIAFVASGKIDASVVHILIFFCLFTFIYAAVVSIEMLTLYLTGIYSSDMSYMSAKAKKNKKSEYKSRFR